MIEKIGYLSEVDLFSDLSKSELAEIESMTTMRTCQKGKIFYRPDEPGEILFILKKGRVRIYNISPEGKELTLVILGKGTIFGEMSLVGQGMYGAFAEALDDLTLCIMKKSDIQKLLITKPRVALRMIEIMGARLKETEKRLEDLAFKDVTKRLATLLLRLAESSISEDRHRIVISEKYTHQQLADMIGTSRETLTRALNQLKAKNLITISHKEIELLDLSQLEEMSV